MFKPIQVDLLNAEQLTVQDRVDLEQGRTVRSRYDLRVTVAYWSCHLRGWHALSRGERGRLVVANDCDKDSGLPKLTTDWCLIPGINCGREFKVPVRVVRYLNKYGYSIWDLETYIKSAADLAAGRHGISLDTD